MCAPAFTECSISGEPTPVESPTICRSCGVRREYARTVKLPGNARTVELLSTPRKSRYGRLLLVNAPRFPRRSELPPAMEGPHKFRDGRERGGAGR